MNDCKHDEWTQDVKGFFVCLNCGRIAPPDSRLRETQKQLFLSIKPNFEWRKDESTRRSHG